MCHIFFVLLIFLSSSISHSGSEPFWRKRQSDTEVAFSEKIAKLKPFLTLETPKGKGEPASLARFWILSISICFFCCITIYWSNTIKACCKNHGMLYKLITYISLYKEG